MGIEENKKTLQRYFDELFNNQNYSKGDEIIHEDFTYAFGGGFKGVEGHKQHTADIHSMFSNLHTRILDMAVEENKAVVLSENTAIQDKELTEYLLRTRVFRIDMQMCLSSKMEKLFV